VLDELNKDEKWHISWMEEWMLRLAHERRYESKAKAQLARYRAIEREVFEAFKEDERPLDRSSRLRREPCVADVAI